MIRRLHTALIPFRRVRRIIDAQQVQQQHLHVTTSSRRLPNNAVAALNLLAVSCVVTSTIVYCHLQGHHEKTTKNESSSASNSPPTKFSLVQSSYGQNHQQHDHHHLGQLSPVLPIRIFRPNPNLEIAFDVRTRNPVYVLERLVVVVDEDDASEITIKRIDEKGGDDDENEDVDDDVGDEEEGEATTSSSTKHLFGGQQRRRRRRRRPRFYEEKQLPEAYRSRNSYYHKSGYDRGHLAPAADFRHYSWRQQEYYYDTFNLCNVSPQHADLNRSTWAYLEHWTRQVAAKCRAKNETAETYVITGPLWLPHKQLSDKLFEYSIHAIGTAPTLVAVPTHFFKVIVVTVACNDDDGTYSNGSGRNNERRISDFACFVMPNGPRNQKQQQQQLHDFLVPWTDLETVSGLQFFPSWTNTSICTRTHQVDDWKRVADTLTAQQQQQQQQRGHEMPLLLLADGKCANSTSSTPISKALPRGRNKKLNSIAAYSNLEHLCRDGKCLHSKRG